MRNKEKQRETKAQKARKGNKVDTN